jgi:hypothetical protein
VFDIHVSRYKYNYLRFNLRHSTRHFYFIRVLHKITVRAFAGNSLTEQQLMQYRVFNILSSHEFFKKEDGYVSFGKFAEFLEEKLQHSDSLRAKYYRFVLKHFKKNPELLLPIKVHKLEKYAYLFDLLESIILPSLANEKELALALSTPMTGEFFFSTEAFYNRIQLQLSDAEILKADEEEALFLYRRAKGQYALVLERFYNFQPFIREEMIHIWTDKETQLTRYFNIDVDNRFVDVVHKGRLPEVNVTQVQQQLANAASFEELEKILPLSEFSFTGFSIVTAADITPRYALHKMRSAIIRHNPGDYDKTYKTIIQLLEQLCGTQDVTFGLLPFLKLNDRLVSYYGNYDHSIMINFLRMLKIPEVTFISWINEYFKNPQTIIKKQFSDENNKSDELFKAFAQLGFNSNAIIPVLYNNEAAGVLEIGVKDASLLDEALLNRIEPAIPILGQLMHQSQTEFTANITAVIRTHFTSIQPAVLWKFNEVAWDYIKNSGSSIKKMDEIRFEHVYPLYGAIDIRNSTIERNNALHKDMRHYFLLVQNVLKQLNVANKNIVAVFMDEAENFLKQTENFFSGNEETAFDTFMNRLNSYLNEMEVAESHHKNIIRKYFKEIDPKNGRVFANRRILENSMQYLNFIITDHLEKMQEELQKDYPVYFERVRTDGIEYDMYVGQSISPKQPYKKSFLNELRLIQLQNMASVTKLVHASARSLPVPLQTTQLIYVNASPIDITFRTDEKRFDVEGSYNIRYQIVKKRIDKVHIIDTGERLTQPGKIAVIYTQHHYEKEYLHFIRELQHQNVLKPNIELFELEELQGVTGLKAIRVEVNLD